MFTFRCRDTEPGHCQGACRQYLQCWRMGFAVRVRSAGQKYGPTCHQRDRADVTEFVTLVRLSSLGQHVRVLALAGYKRRKSVLTAGPIVFGLAGGTFCVPLIYDSPRQIQSAFHTLKAGVGLEENPFVLQPSLIWDNM